MGAELTLVTGASSDIGLALLRAIMTGTDHRVLAHAFRGLAKLSHLAEDFAGRIIPLQADLSNVTETLSFAETVAGYGVPSAIVHLPALKLNYERFTKLKRENFESDIAIQLHAATVLLQRFLPQMAKLPRARVIFMLSSVVHGVPPKFMAHYTVVKYAQLGLMRALAAEFAATSVRINAVSPSMVETQFLDNLSDLAIQGNAANSPLGRNAKPQDIIGAIQFLLSPASDYISGIVLPIAGGVVV
jgi:3-oxoacyl-[acyl-carrier protein] reductase